MITPNPFPKTPRIALIGFRGCGKSAVGRELAARLGGDFIDTDEAIVAHAGKSVAEIFQQEGEEGFRRRERELIQRIASSPAAVISVGGGAILDRQNVDVLKQVATLVWLTAPVEVLWRRIADDPAGPEARPALTGLSGPQEVEHLLGERTPHYQRAADMVVDTTRAGPRDIAAEIADSLGRVDPS